MDINQTFAEYQRTKFTQINHYNQRAHHPMQATVFGYVADVDDLSRLTNSYNVMVPELGNTMLRRVPRKVPGAQTQANGVGHTPSPLRPGQPVLISFSKGRTSLPYIDDSLALNGQYKDIQGGKFPTVDSKDSTNLALFPSPLPPEALAVKGDAEVKVHPLILRSSAPTQPANSATAIEVPGTTYIHDSQGNVYTYFAGQRITVGQNEQKSIEGSRESLADMPMREANLKLQRLQAEVVEQLVHWRTSLGGEYYLETEHPAAGASRKRSTALGSSNATTATTANANPFALPPTLNVGNLPGVSELQGVLSKLEAITGVFDLASKAGLSQLDFLQKKILPTVKKLEDLWGSFNKFGTISLSVQIDLPLNLQVSLSVSYDAKTGTLTLSGTIGMGSGSPISPAPNPLRSEGSTIVGGVQRQVNPQIVIRTQVVNVNDTSIVQDYPQLVGYEPLVADSNNLPYTVVSRDLNDLNFASQPQQALASLLTKYGLSNAGSLIYYLTELVQYGSFFDYLKLATVLAPPLTNLTITTGTILLGGFSDPNTGTVTDGSSTANPVVTIPAEAIDLTTVAKPSQLDCPVLPTTAYTLLQQAADQQTTAVNQSLTGLTVMPPDFQSWVQPTAFTTWLGSVQHPYYPALKTLQDGDLSGFLLLTLYLGTGVDLRAYPNAYQSLLSYTAIAYPQAQLGAPLSEADLKL